MRTILRIIAALLGVAVLLTVLMIVRFTSRGDISRLAHSGVIGIATFVGWFILLTAGPIASVQLWRRRRVGLFVAAALCGSVLAYYLVGLSLMRAPGAHFRPVIEAIVANAALLAILLSPTARKVCS